jgi:outer membrane protein assembly factor BamA
VLLLASATPLRAQTLRLAPDAEVRSLDFRFQGRHELQPWDLAPELDTAAPGWMRGIHGVVAWIPFVPDPAARPFDPVVLQQDLVRLRRHYRREGFLDARVEYEVKADRERKFVDVRFLIEEGPPLRLRTLALATPEEAAGVAPARVGGERFGKDWERSAPRLVGRRFREKGMEDLRRGIVRSLANEGYVRAKAEPRVAIDSVAYQVDLVWVVDRGPRLVFGEIRVEGVHSVPDRFAARQLGFETGNQASPRALERGRSNLLSADLFRSADLRLGDVRGDSVPLLVRVLEDQPRFTKAELGYVTDGAGVSGETNWTHPNFTGGARSLSTLALIQTGWGATSDVPEKLARATVLLTQPYIGSPEHSLSVGPSFEYRDDRTERSTAWSGIATFVKRFSPLQSAALRYEYEYEEVDLTVHERLLGYTQAGAIVPTSGATTLLDSLSEPRRTSLFTLYTNLGRLDDLARPRNGLVVKPTFLLTALPQWGNIHFARLDAQATGFLPLPGRANAVMFRATAGALWPYGESVPATGESPTVDLVQLRDYHLTAGGAGDVRGYENRLLGPKLPQLEEEIVNGDTLVRSNYYVEVGGFRRWTATVELRLGLPLVSRDVFAHVFSDAGRVWTTDSRFRTGELVDPAQTTFFTAGGGIGYYTPVGAIRFDVGYKLNPSMLDLRHPQDVLDALLAGRPASSAPEDKWLRYGYHLALGVFF